MINNAVTINSTTVINADCQMIFFINGFIFIMNFSTNINDFF